MRAVYRDPFFEAFGDDPYEGWSVRHRHAGPLLVFRDADTDVVHASVNRVVSHHRPPAGDEWDPAFDCGPDGALTPEGLDLAINALNAYVPPAEDGAEPVRARHVGLMSATAAGLHEDFAREFLAAMDPDGGEVPRERILAWVEERRPGTVEAMDSMSR